MQKIKEQVNEVLRERNEIFLDARVEGSRKRSLFDLGGKILRWGVGTLDMDDLKTLEKSIKHNEERITTAELYIHHQTDSLKTYTSILNERVNNLADYMNSTSARLHEAIFAETLTSDEVIHLKNLLGNQTGRQTQFQYMLADLRRIQTGVEQLHAGRLSRAIIGHSTLQATLDSIRTKLYANFSHLEVINPFSEHYYRRGSFRAVRIEYAIHILLDKPLALTLMARDDMCVAD